MNKLFLIVALMTGCAASEPPRALTPQEQAEQAKKSKDELECRYEVEKSMASGQRGTSAYSVAFNDFGESMKRGHLIVMCMKTKGYTY